jgi:hypothetical protein
VLTGEGAGRALIVTTDVALGELVKEPLALFVEGFSRNDFATEIAEVGEPVTGIERELRVDLFAEALGQGWAGSRGRDGDLEVSAANDGGEIEVAEGWVVNCVADNVFCSGFVKDGSVDSGNIGSGYDEEVSSKIAFEVLALMPLDLAGGGEVGDAFGRYRGDDGHFGMCGLQGLDLGLSQVATADDDARASGDLKEDREEIHTIRLLLSGSYAQDSLRGFEQQGMKRS